jgi:hypothetical protein
LPLTEIIALAASVSLLSGWRLYLCTFATGLAMKLGWIALPQHLDSLAVLANPWVIGAAGAALAAELFVDKIAWVDSLWDTVHAFIRPVGGALLALAIVDAQDPAWQAVVLLLGGGGALLSHGAKAGTRALVNASPEPVSNVVVSGSEDIATGGMLALAFASPVGAALVAVVLVLAAVALIVMARRTLKALLRARDRMLGPGPSPPAPGAGA